VLVASIGKAGPGEGRGGGIEVDSSSNIDQTPISQSVHNNGNGIRDNDSFKDKVKVKDIPSKFSKTIKIESLIAIGVLLAASLLTITSPPAMNMAMSSMSSSSASTGSMSGMSGMSGMSMTPVKNSTYTIQTKIMNVNTKIEINPFYSGFNTFKVTFTDAAGKPYTKVSSTEIVFGNTAADISNVVANLHKIRPGVFSVTGAYISQPGEWDIALSAQRVLDLDLNYEFNSKVTSAPPVSQNTGTVSQATNANNNSMQEPLPRFDSFAWLAIALAAAVVFGSTFYYRRSKQELRKTVQMLKVDLAESSSPE
jgi:hypothetical protein